ncbi:MAG: Fic family protein [Blastocatellia bacterium]
MKLNDSGYKEEWLNALGSARPAELWQRFVGFGKHPTIRFSVEASAVYSSTIEGNSIDLNFFLNSKLDPASRRFKAKERHEIEDLIAAYDFARSHALNEKNLLSVHAMLSQRFLPKSERGRYRRQLMFVYSQAGIEYAAVESEFVPDKVAELFADIALLRKSKLNVDEVFYHAALLHLIFVNIHPFQDGNGRAARLLEKWFLAAHLGNKAWQIPAERFYAEHRAEYYRNLKIGLNYYTLDYQRCVPFLAMLPKTVGAVMQQEND